jgi:carbonic anhydrase
LNKILDLNTSKLKNQLSKISYINKDNKTVVIDIYSQKLLDNLKKIKISNKKYINNIVFDLNNLLDSLKENIGDIKPKKQIPQQIEQITENFSCENLESLIKTLKLFNHEYDVDYKPYLYERYKREKKVNKLNKKQSSIQTCESNDNKYQSPINIDYPFIAEPHKLTFYKGNAEEIKIKNINNKLITLDANCKLFGSFDYNGKVFEINKIDIHSPSEHTFNLIYSAFELQLISNSNAAVSILFDYQVNNKENELLKIIGLSEDNDDFASNLRNNEDIVIDGDDVEKFLDKLENIFNKENLQFVKYLGSLTNGECKNNINWFILSIKEVTSRKQVEYFKILLGQKSNNRELQDINGRVITAM